MVSRSRMPPPSCTGMSSPTDADDLADRDLVRGLAGDGAVQVDEVQPRAPCSSQCCAIAAGSSEKTVAVVHVALLQAHAVPVLDVDRGND